MNIDLAEFQRGFDDFIKTADTAASGPQTSATPVSSASPTPTAPAKSAIKQAPLPKPEQSPASGVWDMAKSVGNTVYGVGDAVAHPFRTIGNAVNSGVEQIRGAGDKLLGGLTSSALSAAAPLALGGLAIGSMLGGSGQQQQQQGLQAGQPVAPSPEAINPRGVKYGSEKRAFLGPLLNAVKARAANQTIDNFTGSQRFAPMQQGQPMQPAQEELVSKDPEVEKLLANPSVKEYIHRLITST